MTRPSLRLLGGFELQDAGGREIGLTARKARALIAFLAVEAPRWQSRERLAGLLWGRHAETQARNSLNQALHEIRKIENETGVPLVARASGRLRLDPDSVDCDLHRFESLLDGDAPAAAALYGGDLLADFDFSEQSFVDWLHPRRSHYRNLLVEGLLAAAAHAAEDGDTDGAIGAARRVVAIEPLDERGRRLLMRVLARAGNHGEAARQYRVCESLLREELGVEPAPETRAMMQEISRGAAGVAPSVAGGPDPRLALADPSTAGRRPVVAVLPFENASDDADAGWLATGLAEGVIFELSAYRWFRILARTATFHATESAPNPAGLSHVLGARYAVAGRVRRVGSRLRVSVELVDCTDGEQLWSQRYDRTVDDLFDVESDIARQVASAIEPSIEGREMRRVLGRPPETLAAYELLQRGYWHLYRGTAGERANARRCFEAAAESDPAYACAVAALSAVKFREAAANLVHGLREGMTDCLATAEQALSLDPRHPVALRFVAGALSYLGDLERALSAAKRSVELCPSYATGYSALAFAHDYIGNFDDARPAADETVRLRPHDPALYKCIISKAIADYQTGEYECAEKVIGFSLQANNGWWMSNVMRSATAAQRSARDQAREAVERIRADQPGITLELLLDAMPFQHPHHRQHLADGLVRAGWRDDGPGR